MKLLILCALMASIINMCFNDGSKHIKWWIALCWFWMVVSVAYFYFT